VSNVVKMSITNFKPGWHLVQRNLHCLVLEDQDRIIFDVEEELLPTFRFSLALKLQFQV